MGCFSLNGLWKSLLPFCPQHLPSSPCTHYPIDLLRLIRVGRHKGRNGIRKTQREGIGRKDEAFIDQTVNSSVLGQTLINLEMKHWFPNTPAKKGGGNPFCLEKCEGNTSCANPNLQQKLGKRNHICPSSPNQRNTYSTASQGLEAASPASPRMKRERKKTQRLGPV